MTATPTVLIAGGGLNGLCLAVALDQAGIDCAVVDRADLTARRAPDFDGRAYALALSTRRMLEALGLWSRVGGQAEAILDIHISGGRTGAPVLHFDHLELDEGPMGHFLEDRFLRAALLDRVEAAPHVTLMSNTVVEAETVTPAGVAVTLSSGQTVKTRLLVAADGRRSPIAARAGIRRLEVDYRQTSLVTAIDHAVPHQGTAAQVFLPEGPLAMLPLPGNRSSLVWTESAARAAAINALDDAAYLAVLRPRFGDHLGEIALAGVRYSYPIGLSLATRLTAPRLALVGDAGHGIHPLAGQGLNLGFRDTAALAEVLAEAVRRGEDPGAADVLERYRRWRSFDIAALSLATDGINRIFSNSNPVLGLGRTLALGAVQPLDQRGRWPDGRPASVA